MNWPAASPIAAAGPESPGGFEPPTLNLGGSCSVLLSYGDRMVQVYHSASDRPSAMLQTN